MYLLLQLFILKHTKYRTSYDISQEFTFVPKRNRFRGSGGFRHDKFCDLAKLLKRVTRFTVAHNKGHEFGPP